MAIPDYQTTMLPLLTLADDGKERTLREATDELAGQFKLTVDERRAMLPSGQQSIFDNRVGWARTYMKKAGLLETPRRGHILITKRGRKVLSERPQRIDVAFLEEFQAFRARKREPLRGAYRTKSTFRVSAASSEEILTT